MAPSKLREHANTGGQGLQSRTKRIKLEVRREEREGHERKR